MSTVWNNEDTVVFVGCRGTKAGDANAGGGCTKVFWDVSGDFADVMGPNGQVLSAGAAWDGGQTGCTVTIAGGPMGGRILITRAGAFTNCEAGLIANVEFEGIYVDGRYKVFGKIDNDRIVLDEPHTFDTTCDIKVGGSFPTVMHAVAYSSAMFGYNVQIYTNVFTETLIANWLIGAVGGSVANNSHKIVEGFHTVVGDMNRGGAYYQSPLDCLINGVDTTTPKCISIDANGGAYDVVQIDTTNCIFFKNLYFHNTNKAGGNNAVEFINNPKNIGFTNCRFDTAYYIFSGTVYGSYFEDCYVGNDYAYAYGSNSYQYGGLLVNCVFNGEGKSANTWLNYAEFNGCLFWKSTYGIYTQRPNAFVGCVFYGQTYSCIRVANATYAMVRGLNNIFIPADAADYVVYSTGAFGGVSNVAMRKSCIWTLAGVAVTNHVFANAINRQLEDVIELDPLFEDAAGGNFTLKTNSPCLKTGLPTLGKL